MKRTTCLQLLGAVIQHEKPELEVQKSQLLKQEEELKIELAKLEEALLEVRYSISHAYKATYTEENMQYSDCNNSARKTDINVLYFCRNSPAQQETF